MLLVYYSLSYFSYFFIFKRVLFLNILSRTQTSLRQNAEVDWYRHRRKSERRNKASCSSEVPGLLSSTRDTNLHGSHFGAF